VSQCKQGLYSSTLWSWIYIHVQRALAGDIGSHIWRRGQWCRTYVLFHWCFGDLLEVTVCWIFLKIQGELLFSLLLVLSVEFRGTSGLTYFCHFCVNCVNVQYGEINGDATPARE
jgi:hypothetical protein